MRHGPTNGASSEDRKTALNAVLESRTFARADQLRALLKYLCEAEAGGRHDLSEYVIGTEVLGRPEDFSPLADSSVRTRVYELRHKLDRYYRIEGKDQLLRIQIPKGGYLPLYERVAEDVEPVAEPVSAQETEPSREVRSIPRWQWAIAGLILAVLVVVATAWRYTAAPSVDPILREAWGPLSKRDANVLLCVATPLHLTVVPESHRKNPSYPAPSEAYPLWRQHRPLGIDAKLGLVFTDNVIGFGTMNSILTTSQTLLKFGAGYQILPERVAPISTFRDRNVVLFGAPVDSEAVTRMQEPTPLIVEHDDSIHDFVIRDRASGKTHTPEKDERGDYRVVYGLVTVLNHRSSAQGPLGSILFSGITSAGTQGAAEYFSSPAALRDLKAKFVAEGHSGFPTQYQVVVRCTFSNMLLLSYEAVEHRALAQK